MSTKTHRLVEDLRELDETQLPAISNEIDAIKAKTKARMEQNLRGVADLAVMGKPKGSPFVVVYWRNNKACTLEGVDYAKGQYIDEKRESDERRVYVHGDDYPVSGNHTSMDALRKTLKLREIPYVTRYFDEN